MSATIDAPANDRGHNDRRWWTRAKGSDVHEQIAGAVVEMISKDQRREAYANWRALYCDEPTKGLISQGRTRRHRHNLIASLVDAAHAKQIKQRPRPQILTSEGSTVQQRKAKDLTEWVAGEFERLDLYECVMEPAAMESKLVGTGVLKGFVHDGRPCMELAYAEDIFVDPREQKHNAVRTLYHARAVDRHVLAGMYPKYKARIMDAPPSVLDPADDANDGNDMADLVMVVEAWRLPSSEKMPGRHAICIDGCTLRHVEYTKHKFPFRKLHWKPKPRSWFGIGLVEGEAGTQAELNALTQTISDAYALCVPIVIVGMNQKLNRHQVTNEPWAWYTTDGDPNAVKVHMPPAISPDFTMREDRLIARSFERNRISQLSAQGQKPAGLNSGKALIVHNDIDNENHVVPNRAYERLCVEAGELLVELAEDIYQGYEQAKERGEDVAAPDLTTYSGKDSLRELDFGDVRLGDDPMVMRAYPISSLAASPQARYEQIAEQMQMGLLSREQGLMLLDNPDMDAWNRREFADRRLVDKILDDALAYGKHGAAAVSRYMNLPYARKQAWLAYNEAHILGAPQSHIDALEEICGAIEQEIEQLKAEEAEKQAAAQAAAPQPTAPMGAQMQPPTPALPLPGAA